MADEINGSEVGGGGSAWESLQQAYELSAQRFAQVEGADDVSINLDVPTAVTVVTGSLAEMQAYRADIARILPNVVGDFDMLRTYAYGLLYLHSEARSVTPKADDLAELVKDATAQRDLYIACAKSLIRQGVMNGAVLGALTNRFGYKNVAMDLASLSSALRKSGDKLGGTTKFLDLDKSDRLVTRIFETLAVREQWPLQQNEIVLARKRGYKLVVDTYEDARAVVQVVRRRLGGADDIAPSLFAGRVKRTSSEPAEQVAPSAPKAAAPATTEAPAASAFRAQFNEVTGHPDSDPLGGAQ